MSALTELRWNDDGLIPAIIQDISTRQVLMLGWMNAEALRLTLVSGYLHLWSRSRQELWRKGESSGAVMVVSSVHYDCDGDAVLVTVAPSGPACHTGNTSCFYRELRPEEVLVVDSAEWRAAGEPAFAWPAEAAEGADN